jgi:nicotinamide-nucleotide adenylyltransferase
VLLEQGIARDAFMVVPFPINLPELYRWYVPLDATFFVTIYDDWGRAKLQRFNDLGLRTHVLRDVPNDEKGLSASQVRQLMQQGGNWQSLVPPAAARLLVQWDIPQRLLQLAQD